MDLRLQKGLDLPCDLPIGLGRNGKDDGLRIPEGLFKACGIRDVLRKDDIRKESLVDMSRVNAFPGLLQSEEDDVVSAQGEQPSDRRSPGAGPQYGNAHHFLSPMRS